MRQRLCIGRDKLFAERHFCCSNGGSKGQFTGCTSIGSTQCGYLRLAGTAPCDHSLRHSGSDLQGDTKCCSLCDGTDYAELWPFSILCLLVMPPSPGSALPPMHPPPSIITTSLHFCQLSDTEYHNSSMDGLMSSPVSETLEHKGVRLPV